MVVGAIQLFVILKHLFWNHRGTAPANQLLYFYFIFVCASVSKKILSAKSRPIRRSVCFQRTAWAAGFTFLHHPTKRSDILFNSCRNTKFFPECTIVPTFHDLVFQSSGLIILRIWVSSRSLIIRLILTEENSNYGNRFLKQALVGLLCAE